MMRPLLFTAVLAAGLVSAAPSLAASDQQQIVDHAKIAIGDMYSDSSFGNAKDLIKRAKAVMIVPELVKGGFFVGGEGGNGVLLVKSGSGTWSAPAFYTVGAASFGLQIGVETAEVVFFVMSDKALRAWMKNEVKRNTTERDAESPLQPLRSSNLSRFASTCSPASSRRCEQFGPERETPVRNAHQPEKIQDPHIHIEVQFEVVRHGTYHKDEQLRPQSQKPRQP